MAWRLASRTSPAPFAASRRMSLHVPLFACNSMHFALMRSRAALLFFFQDDVLDDARQCIAELWYARFVCRAPQSTERRSIPPPARASKKSRVIMIAGFKAVRLSSSAARLSFFCLALMGASSPLPLGRSKTAQTALQGPTVIDAATTGASNPKNKTLSVNVNSKVSAAVPKKLGDTWHMRGICVA